MSFPRKIASVRVSILCCSMLVAAGFAVAQSAPSSSANQTNASSSSSSAGYSSSDDLKLPQLAELSSPEGAGALPAAPKPAAAAGQGNGGWRHSLMSRYALEFGGGFNAPKSDSITWGGNFTVGGGVNFSKRFATLIEYQFIDDKLPGNLIAETGATGGHAHIWSLTVDPVISLLPSSSHDIYVTGGGGFYRKVTSFTDPAPALYCSYFYGCGTVYVPQVVGHFSSNQGGWNIGGGYQHRMGGMYGDSKMKLFAEARYVDVLTPAYGGSANGLGPATVRADTKMIPVTFGIRW